MVKLEKIDGGKISLEIEVAEKMLEDALGQAYKKVVKNVNLPGFRKGKVPRPILESHFGSEVLYEEALEILVPDAYEKAVEETSIEPVAPPEIDLLQMEKGKPLIFKAIVEVKPEIELPEYRGVQIDREVREITGTDVANRLAQMQKQHVKLHVLADAPLASGDVALLDFTGYVDGVPFDGGSAENYTLEVGSGSFIPGFEEQMVGMNIGEEKDIAVSFPEEYHNEDLAGKPAIFKIKLNEIKRKELPELNDDFAAEVSEFATLAELKDDILNKLKEAEEKKSSNEVAKRVVETLAESIDVLLPAALVDREVDRMISEMENFMKMQGLNLEKFLSLTQQSVDGLRLDKRLEAEKRVRADLLLDAIVKKEGIEATDEEVKERIGKMAESYGQPVEVIEEYFAAPGQAEALFQEIKVRKAIDFLVAEAKITNVVAPATKEEK
ncbi:MAG: trigger factor [Dethiobacter sp.]|nr:trigger factor [Dethiobacter sp.]MBS3901147.1 trigger factor [Dethiobacter sp.]MBS3989061.1 trigger factor [Dethiobacter sp.]